ncbi:hypothetical protein [Streptomyces sp. WELS2]|uniref:hypothetical protein n=1 Tax=Streptomyces sp. WELS2 TaxID=2749435 RepID=UPI00215DB00F|nr:hypothetical protein [Streptomyces sp. WELS2]
MERAQPDRGIVKAIQAIQTIEAVEAVEAVKFLLYRLQLRHRLAERLFPPHVTT